MVQKKTSKQTSKRVNPKNNKKVPAVKPVTALQTVKPHPVPVVQPSAVERQTVYPVLSFVLFVVALVIWFFVGSLFMQLAVREDFCHIRYWDAPEHSGEIVAVVGGEKIYMSEVKDYLEAIPQLKELPFETVYPQLLETVVNARVLQRAAEKAGTETQENVQRALQLAHDQIVAQAWLDEKLSSMVTPQRLRQLYRQEMKNWVPTEEVRARHILVQTEKEAKDLAVQLKNGANFGTLAGQHSLDKSSPDGDLGYFTEDMMIPEFGKAVFSLKKDQVSEPIKTPFGWHIVRVEDRRLTKKPSFESVREDLKKILMERNLTKVLADERRAQRVEIKKPTL